MSKDLLDAFAKLVNSHDLTFMYSDDPSCYRRGKDSFDKIRAMAKQLPHPEATRIWNEKVRKEVIDSVYAQFAWVE